MSDHAPDAEGGHVDDHPRADQPVGHRTDQPVGHRAVPSEGGRR